MLPLQSGAFCYQKYDKKPKSLFIMVIYEIYVNLWNLCKVVESKYFHLKKEHTFYIMIYKMMQIRIFGSPRSWQRGFRGSDVGMMHIRGGTVG